MPTSKADILIVDDALDHLHLVSTILEKEGYQVQTATNGKAALQAVES